MQLTAQDHDRNAVILRMRHDLEATTTELKDKFHRGMEQVNVEFQKLREECPHNKTTTIYPDSEDDSISFNQCCICGQNNPMGKNHKLFVADLTETKAIRVVVTAPNRDAAFDFASIGIWMKDITATSKLEPWNNPSFQVDSCDVMPEEELEKHGV